MSSVLLIGGLAMTGEELRPLSESIKGTRFLFFDNINVGKGPRLDLKVNRLSIEDQARHQWALIDENLGKNAMLSIFGISMGGMIAATMASMQPQRVSGLMLAATSGNFPGIEAVPEDIYQKWTSAKTPEEVWDSVTIAFGKTTLEKKPEIARQYFKYRVSGANKQSPKEFISQVISIKEFNGTEIYKKLSTFEIPTVVVAGDEDLLFDTRHSDAIIGKLKNSRLETLEKTGHMLHLENPDGLGKALSVFLNHKSDRS